MVELIREMKVLEIGNMGHESKYCDTVIFFLYLSNMFLFGSEVMVYLDVSIINFSLMKATKCC